MDEQKKAAFLAEMIKLNPKETVDTDNVPALLDRDRVMDLWLAGKAMLDFASAAPESLFSSAITERATNMGLGLVQNALSANIPAEQVAMQVDGQIRQGLGLLLYLHERALPEDRILLEEAMQHLNAAFVDLWNDELEHRLDAEESDRPKIRVQVGPRLAVPNMLLDPSKLRR